MKLVLVHGAGSYPLTWHYQTKRFPDADAVALPGHPEGKPGAGIDEYVEWLRGHVKEQGYHDVVLAGHSMGGAIALLYALDYQDELKALILISTGARLRVGPALLDLCREGTKNMSRWLAERELQYRYIAPQVRKIFLQESARVGPAVQLNDLLCCDQFDVMSRLHEIRLPTLVLCGSLDEVTPAKFSRYLAEHIQGAQLQVFEGATHHLPAEKPVLVNRAIEDFLVGWAVPTCK